MKRGRCKTDNIKAQPYYSLPDPEVQHPDCFILSPFALLLLKNEASIIIHCKTVLSTELSANITTP